MNELVFFIDNGLESDTAVLEREMVTFAQRVAQDYPEVGALVLECTNFVPYSQAMLSRISNPASSTAAASRCHVREPPKASR